MLTKVLRDLTIADIESLTGQSESRSIDFKSAPVGNSDRDRREFVADVTAFANAAGGDIVFGVAAPDGVATGVPGINVDNPDQERLRLGDLIRGGTEPRLTNFEIEWLPMQGNLGVLVVRAPRSWIAPHRVTLQGHDKFYVRNAAGKHPMNVDELRQAFTLSQSVAERIRAFRTERVRELLAGEGPLPLPPNVKFIFHLVPLRSFVDPPDLKLAPDTAARLRPLGVMGYSWRYTLEGYANFNSADGEMRAYTLAFRNGIIEAVARVHKQEPENLISATVIERLVLEGWNEFKSLFFQHGIEAPFVAFLTVTNMKGVSVHLRDPHNFNYQTERYHRDQLFLPEVVITADQLDREAPVLFRPLFDMLANTFGLARSFNYTPEGTYQPR